MPNFNSSGYAYVLFRTCTGHAFTGTQANSQHAARFTGRKFAHPLPELVARHCGELPQTVEHDLLGYPRHKTATRKHRDLNARGRVRSLDQFFKKILLCVGTLRSLKETKDLPTEELLRAFVNLACCSVDIGSGA